MRRFITPVAAISAALLLFALPAAADVDAETHPDIEYALAAVPGGVVLGDDEVVWPDLGMTLTVEPEFARAIGSCATGTYCAYAGGGMSGSKLTFSVCGNVSTSALRTVGSIANGRSSGLVKARNSAGTVLGTASSNTSVNVASGTVGLLCSL